MVKTPAIIVNLKTYERGLGDKGLELLGELEKASSSYPGQVAVAVGPPDIFRYSQESELPVFSQHIDAVGFGSNTGHIHPLAVKEAGAVGTLINHSERRIDLADIEAAVSVASDLGLETCVCSNNVATSGAIAALGPDYVAVEPPELIGGDISVSTAKPSLISGTVERVKEIDDSVLVLCGAGVKNGKDIRTAIELGSSGVLLASGVVKSDDVQSVMADLLGGLG